MKFWLENVREMDHLDDTRMKEKKTEINLNETKLKATEWIDPVQSSDWWYTLVKTIMNLQFQ
jgi:hypothetical protein